MYRLGTFKWVKALARGDTILARHLFWVEEKSQFSNKKYALIITRDGTFCCTWRKTGQGESLWLVLGIGLRYGKAVKDGIKVHFRVKVHVRVRVRVTIRESG